MDRRNFINKIIVGVVGITCIPSIFARKYRSKKPIQVMYASGFDAPYIAHRLRPGLKLDVRSMNKRDYLVLDGNIIGILPISKPDRRHQSVRVNDTENMTISQISRDSQGRLVIFVEE